MRVLALALLVFGAAANPVAAAPLPPAAGGELLVMNDGMKAVQGVRVRRVGDEAWSPDLLGGEDIPVGEGRRIDLTGRDLGCLVEVETTVAGRGAPVVGEQDVCGEDPRYWMGFALGLDAPGMGVRPGTYAVVVGEEEEEAPAAEPGMAGGAVPDLNRGLPVCPGDPRCRKKK